MHILHNFSTLPHAKSRRQAPRHSLASPSKLRGNGPYSWRLQSKSFGMHHLMTVPWA